LRIHQGLFLSLGIEDWRSFAPALLRLVDQPKYVRQILDIQVDLLPEVGKCPFNALWLCEASPEALTPTRVRKLVPVNMTLIGGIDSDVLRGDKLAIRQSVAGVKPFVQAGRFIPLADGRVREDVPYWNYAFYRRELEKEFVGNLRLAS
jgi:hypothetical protein